MKKAVDIACSAGESTRRLAARFPEAQLAGIDLSPNFLAVAELRRRYWHPSSTVVCIADGGPTCGVASYSSHKSLSVLGSTCVLITVSIM